MKKFILLICILVLTLLIYIIYIDVSFERYDMSGGNLKGFYIQILIRKFNCLDASNGLLIGKSFTTYAIYDNKPLPSGETCLGIEKEAKEASNQNNLIKYCYGVKIAHITRCRS